MKQVISILILFLLACNHSKSLKIKDWVMYIENEKNGFKKIVTTQDFIYEVQYKPAELIALKESISEKIRLESRIKQLENTVWFNVAIKSRNGQVNPLKNNLQSMAQYNSRLDFYLYQAEKYFSCTYNGVPAEKIGYFFENNYGLTPMDIMIIGFHIPDKKPLKELTLQFDDVYNNNSMLKFSVTKNDLKKIPLLIL